MAVNADQPGCICSDLRQAARLLSHTYDAALSPVGLTINQFSILKLIRAHAALNQRQVAAMLGMKPSTVSRSLRLLQKLGHLDLSPGRDPRTRMARLTSAGTKVLAAAEDRWRAQQLRTSRIIAADEHTIIRSIATRLNGSLQNDI